jgi:hypothetical protein
LTYISQLAVRGRQTALSLGIGGVGGRQLLVGAYRRIWKANPQKSMANAAMLEALAAASSSTFPTISVPGPLDRVRPPANRTSTRENTNAEREVVQNSPQD